MRKFYVKKEDLNNEELRSGRVSYGRIISRYIDNLVLCNNITEIDFGIYDNMNRGESEEIFQYYLCNLTRYERDLLIECGIILSYSNVLDLDVLCVDHWGTSWDYVMTDVEWSENYEECK